MSIRDMKFIEWVELVNKTVLHYREAWYEPPVIAIVYDSSFMIWWGYFEGHAANWRLSVVVELCDLPPESILTGIANNRATDVISNVHLQYGKKDYSLKFASIVDVLNILFTNKPAYVRKLDDGDVIPHFDKVDDIPDLLKPYLV
jgi:hypothetical protein